MTVIAVNHTDGGKPGLRWAVPADPKLIISYIPRGLRHYDGIKAVPTLGTTDETAVKITFTFPDAFIYICKSVSMTFVSDDLTSDMDNQGTLRYIESNFRDKEYLLNCNGASFPGAVKSTQMYEPIGTWRQMINAPLDATMVFLLSDISTDASTAGDVIWTADFWEYDINQCAQWPVNSPAPQVAY